MLPALLSISPNPTDQPQHQNLAPGVTMWTRKLTQWVATAAFAVVVFGHLGGVDAATCKRSWNHQVSCSDSADCCGTNSNTGPFCCDGGGDFAEVCVSCYGSSCSAVRGDSYYAVGCCPAGDGGVCSGKGTCNRDYSSGGHFKCDCVNGYYADPTLRTCLACGVRMARAHTTHHTWNGL